MSTALYDLFALPTFGQDRVYRCGSDTQQVLEAAAYPYKTRACLLYIPVPLRCDLYFT